MMLLFIYILLMLAITGIALALNWKYRWIDKRWIKNESELFGLVVMAFVVWPIGLLCLVGGLIIAAVHKYLIP